MSEVGEVKYKVVADDSDLDQQINKTEGKLTSKFGGVAAKVGKVVTGAVMAGTAAVGAFAKSAVDAGMNFDASMSQVAATMGKTVDEISELRDFAQEMGAKTAFSASQAADALNYMALAGYDAETSMSMLPNVLNLAAAGGMELATASDMITDASSALGLSLDETATMVDQMAKTSSKSNTSVQQLGEAMLTVGGTAKTLRGGTVELSQALGILADNGVKGSEGGTALRNIILSLSAPTEKAAKELERLGINAFDANGNMLPLQDIMGQFNTALGDMSSQEKTQVLNNIFNKVDLKSVNALMDTNVERWGELRQAINGAWYSTESLSAAFEKQGLSMETITANLAGLGTSTEDIQAAFDYAGGSVDEFIDYIETSTEASVSYEDIVKALGGDLGALQAAFDETTGAAQAMADTQLDNLAGDVTLFQSALEGTKIAVSDSLTPALREFVQFGAEGLSQLTEAFKTDGISGAMEQLGTILSDGIAMIADKAPSMVEAGLGLVEALGKGLLDNMDKITKSAVDIVMMLAQKLIAPDTLHGILQAGIQLIVSLDQGLTQAIPQLIPAAVEAVMDLAEYFLDNIDMIIDTGIELLIALATGLVDAIPKLLDKIPVIIERLIEAITRNAPKLVVGALRLMIALADGLIQAIPRLILAIPEILAAIVGGFAQGAVQLVETGADLVKGLWEGIKKSWSHLVDNVKNLGKNLVKSVKDIFRIGSPSKLFRDEVGKWIPEGIAVGIEENHKSVTDSIGSLADDTLKSAGDVLAGSVGLGYDLPDIAGYAADLSAAITASSATEIIVPLSIDGREIARASAWFMSEQLAWEAR